MYVILMPAGSADPCVDDVWLSMTLGPHETLRQLSKNLPCAFGAPDMSEETFTLHDCGRGIPYPLLGTMPIVGWHQGHISLSDSSSTD